jgi:sec-independent protein translocase protein TatA
MFGAKSLMHWIIVLGIFLLLFGGRNKISDLMGDVARGIKSFKKGLNEDDSAAPEAADAKPVGQQAGRIVDGAVDRKVG